MLTWTSLLFGVVVAWVVASLMSQVALEKYLERIEDRYPVGKRPIGYRIAQLLLLPAWLLNP